MAALHATAFDGAARWSSDAFAGALADPRAFALGDARAFALGRVILDEAELLTLVVASDQRRRGRGRTLLAAFDAAARGRDAATAYLEVAAANVPALAFYEGAGWREAGRRRGYYGGIDALILRKPL